MEPIHRDLQACTSTHVRPFPTLGDANWSSGSAKIQAAFDEPPYLCRPYAGAGRVLDIGSRMRRCREDGPKWYSE